MPFKIIETIECGRRLIASVPSSWESDGNLYWPKKNVVSLKKNENSVPQSDWKSLPCILKRDHILNYKTAEEEIALMSDFTDTDEKENEYPRQKTSIKLNLNDLVTKSIQEKKINEELSPILGALGASSAMVANHSPLLGAAEEASSVIVLKEAPSIVVADKTVAATVATVRDTGSSSLMTAENASPVMVTEPKAPLHEDLDIIIQNISQNINSDTPIMQDIENDMLQPDEDLLVLPDSDEHLIGELADTQVTITESVPQQTGFIIEILTAVQENQKVLFDNQQNILKGLALLNTKLEQFFSRSQGPFQQLPQENLSRFKTIISIEELIAFEEQLKDSTMETKYFESLSINCSEKKSGYNNAYALVDTMFDRKFMTRCSWGGGTKGEPKHCFKAFPKTIDLFLKVVHQYDKQFTKPVCEDFFKNVLRHSVKRNSAKRVRNSTMKNKIKKSKVVVNLSPEHRPGPS